MAHLWLRSDRESGLEWAVLPLSTDRLALPDGLPGSEGAPSGGAPVQLLRSPGPAPRWVLLARDTESVRVNGLQLPLGIRALRDRDEIRVRGRGTIFFSTEMLAAVVACPGDRGAIRCARCHRTIEPGDPAVACPTCALHHHEGLCQDGVERRCWTYAETCAYDAQPTSLDADYTWSPENR
jgi:hypothetical protein